MLSDQKNTQNIGFLLLPNFSLMSYASASEPLRAANLLAGIDLYRAVPMSFDGGTVRSSSGALIECVAMADAGPGCHTIFVCAGGDPEDWQADQAGYAILGKLSRRGIRLGAISSGAYVLAAARLLDRRDFTIHWEHAGALREAFPHLLPRQARFVVDGDRITCAGGVAPLDMMHAIIAERMGAHFARRVTDWYLYTAVAEPEAAQRSSSAQRFGTFHPTLLLVLEKMEATIENPLDRAAMARFAGTSTRHLDRLFSERINSTFLETYRSIRLAHGRRLLEQSSLSIGEIAFATGFSSAGHFSRAFKAWQGSSPATFRQAILHK